MFFICLCRGEPLVQDERVHIYDNGSLWISDLQGKDAANYTCRAQNDLGADEIQITLVVQGIYIQQFTQ